MELFDLEYRRLRPFLSSVLIAFFLCGAFVLFMLFTLPATMDMDGFIHFLMTIFILPFLFIVAFFFSYLYLKTRSTLYIARRDEQPLGKVRMQLAAIVVLTVMTFGGTGYALHNLFQEIISPTNEAILKPKKTLVVFCNKTEQSIIAVDVRYKKGHSKIVEVERNIMVYAKPGVVDLDTIALRSTAELRDVSFNPNERIDFEIHKDKFVQKRCDGF